MLEDNEQELKEHKNKTGKLKIFLKNPTHIQDKK